jgi:Ca2+-transporting ATPase
MALDPGPRPATVRPRTRSLPGRLRTEIRGLRGDADLARRIEQDLARVAGVTGVEANPLTGRVLVVYDRARLGVDRLLDAVAAFEQALVPPAPPRRAAGRRRSRPRGLGYFVMEALQPVVGAGLLVGLGLKVVLRGPDPRATSERLNAASLVLSAITGYPQLFRWARRICGPRIPASTILGYATIALKAWREALLGLATDTGWHLLEHLERSALRDARRDLRALLHPSGHARLLDKDAREFTIPVSEIQPGELIRLEAGERVAADGRVVGGAGLVDESVFSHRVFLARKRPGDPVYLGTWLRQGTLTVRVARTGPGSRLGQELLAVPPRARGGVPGTARVSRRIGAAGLTLSVLAGLASRDWRRALGVLTSLNPMPIGQSTIAAAGAAVEAAAREHVRVQRRAALHRLGGIDVVLFGKTGTLTAEFPMVDTILPTADLAGDAILTLAASALRLSSHPVAVPLMEKALELQVDLAPAAHVQITPEQGVEARVGDAAVLLGGTRLMRDRGLFDDAAGREAERLASQGEEALFIVRDDRIVGIIGLRERLLPGAREAVAGLRAEGIVEVGIVSGDPTPSVARLASDLGVERIWPGVSDHDKAAVVETLQCAGHIVAFVGASAGDMQALARADVGIGFAGAVWTPTPSAADVMLLHGRLDVLPQLIELCRRFRTIARQNGRIAIAVSTLAAGAAITGLLPWAVADEIGQYTTLALFANARRLTLVPVAEPPVERAGKPGQPPWHALSARDAAGIVAADMETGLSDAEAARRLRRFGPNELMAAPSLGFVGLYWRQLSTGMTVPLAAAAAASLVVGEPLNAAMIASVVLINAGLGAFQELRGQIAVAALHGKGVPMALCRRDAELQRLPATRLVPGDLVMLRAGDTVPADGRIVESYGLEVEESALTGESQSVYKSAAAVRADAPLADRSSLVFMGSAVLGGRARMLVIGTGMRTAVGQIAGLLEPETGAPAFLQTRLARLGRGSAVVALACGAAFIGAGALRRAAWSTLVLGSISLVTAAIPEGLPGIVTIALAAAVQRMSRRGLVVRRLSAVESLGRVDVICCDKTGTLTQNRMELRAVSPSTGGRLEMPLRSVTPDLRRLLTIGAVCNDVLLAEDSAGAVSRSTEGALVAGAASAGLDPRRLRRLYRRIAELPFSTDRGFMAVAVGKPRGGLSLMVKGAPERILDLCTHRLDGGTAVSLDAATRARIIQTVEGMAHDAMRVLAMAYRPLAAPPAEAELADPEGCVFAGCVGLHDPLRPEVRDALVRCERMGARVVMATGDHQSTAVAVARQLGLDAGRDAVLDGMRLDALTDAELAARAAHTRVFARVSPRHKLRIVTGLQRAGAVVAMTGDGVNDAPAVRQADVGIAMGLRSTEVTRQAASIVVSHDSFASIVDAIEEGRTVQRNLRRSLGFLLGGNLGEALFMVGATISTGDIPLLPLHILLVNLFTDALPVVALAGLPSLAPAPAVRDVFDRGFYRDILRRGLVTGVAASAIQALAMTQDPAGRRTTALGGLVASQLVQAHRWGSGERGDRFFYGSLAASWAALFAVLSMPPLQRLFGTRPLAPAAWARILLISVAVDRALPRPDGPSRATRSTSG